jgi:hypothetical protein
VGGSDFEVGHVAKAAIALVRDREPEAAGLDGKVRRFGISGHSSTSQARTVDNDSMSR